jgi:hypothetical protein
MTMWSTPVSDEYYRETQRRYREWEQAGSQPHHFMPDSIASWLYCERCGCERGATHHIHR